MSKTYEIGVWNGWKGGECPVPPDTKGHYKTVRGNEVVHVFIGNITQSIWRNEIVAFCVTDYPPEKKTSTGRCWAMAYDDKEPALSEVSFNENAALGTYKVTTVNGKPTKIVWEADQ